MSKLSHKKIWIIPLLIVFVFSCLFVFTSCDDKETSTNDGSNAESRIQLTVNNISNYLGIRYDVEKTKYNSNTIANYVNHEYEVETYSLGNYNFVNLVIEIGVKGASDQNSISSDGYGSFFFVRNGPLQPSMSPSRPTVKRVVSGYVEI